MTSAMEDEPFMCSRFLPVAPDRCRKLVKRSARKRLRRGGELCPATLETVSLLREEGGPMLMAVIYQN